MVLSDELTKAVADIAIATWTEVDGRVVPESEDIGLGNHGVTLDAAMLYADLADSTEMAVYNRRIAAEVYKAFLLCCSKIILAQHGHVRSFDGDRVMGVFIGDSKNTNAVTAALNINWAFTYVIKPQFNMYDAFKNGTLKLAHSAGVDQSEVLVARSGVRNNNDLVWVGRAPNVAAKLSTVRQSPYNSWITKTVFESMNKTVKVWTDGRDMWESSTWTDLPPGSRDVYRSSWWVKP